MSNERYLIYTVFEMLSQKNIYHIFSILPFNNFKKINIIGNNLLIKLPKLL